MEMSFTYGDGRPQPRERDLHQLSDLRQGRTRPTVQRQDRLDRKSTRRTPVTATSRMPSSA